MPFYKVLQSFVSTEIGPHAQDEIIEVSREQAKNLPLELVEKTTEAIETADLKPQAETADVKAPRRSKQK